MRDSWGIASTLSDLASLSCDQGNNAEARRLDAGLEAFFEQWPPRAVIALRRLMSVFLIATSQAQSDLSVFTGKFTLTHQILRGETLLRPGNYTIRIGSSRMPAFALIRDGQGRPVARFMSGIDAGRAGAGNALLLSEKGGQLRVHSLALGKPWKRVGL
jgi:hypothetical protein